MFDWKQGETASQALSEGNKISLPAPLSLTNWHIVFFVPYKCKNDMVMCRTISWPPAVSGRQSLLPLERAKLAAPAVSSLYAKIC